MSLPNLDSSVLDVGGQIVSANISFKIQDNPINFTLAYPVAAVLANAAAKGRTDWSVQDLLDLATAEIGLTVTANVTTI